MTPQRQRRLSVMILAVGAASVFVLETKLPKDQHVRFALGDAAPEVTELEVQYVAAGELASGTRLAFDPGRAPRVVAHDPSLANGAYQLRIELDTREGRRSVERQVTLTGGTTQVDLSGVLLPRSP